MRSPSSEGSEAGTVLPVVLFVTMSVGALAMAHLTAVVAENRKIRAEVYAQRAQALADAELELAKNIINSAPYDGADKNTALLAAVEANPPLVPGSLAQAESLGGDWYVVTAIGSYQGMSRRAQAFVRTRTPLTSYNYFVMEHKLGISGSPRGRIHSNDKIQFYFPWGTFRDEISAVNGFEFLAGATPANTRFLGQHNENSAERDLLGTNTIADLASIAETMRVDDQTLIAEVEFQGSQTEVRLFTPETTIQVPRETTRRVFSHYEYADVEQQVAVYRDEIVQIEQPVYEQRPYTVQVSEPVYEYEEYQVVRNVPIYEWQDITSTYQAPVYAYRDVERTETRQRWVEDPPPQNGGEATGTDLSGTAAVPGHWESYQVTVIVNERYISHYESRTRTDRIRVQIGTQEVTETRTRRIQTGTTIREVTQYQTVQVGTVLVDATRRVFSHYDTVTLQRQIPIYIDVPVTVYDTVVIPEQLVETRVVPTTGIVYLAGPIRSVQGQVNGRLTLVTNSTARVTDSIQYVDSDGRLRMQNGTDTTRPYEANPEYQGRSALAILANGDVRYGVEVPSHIEINASLISVNGMVGFEGLSVGDDGSTVTFQRAPGTTDSDYHKESIRRLGGIVTRKRPISTHIDGHNQLIAGFRRGASMMDRKLMIESGGGAITQGGLEQNQPTWTVQVAGRQLETMR